MKKRIKTVIGVVMTGALLYFLLRQIDYHDILVETGKLTASVLVSVVALYAVMYLIRGVQLKKLVVTKADYFSLSAIAGAHNFMNMVLPARIGELSLLYFLRKKDVEVAESASKLLFIRITDALATIVTLIVAVVVLGGEAFRFEGLVTGSLIILLVIGLVILFLMKVTLLIRLYDFFTGWLQWRMVRYVRGAIIHMSRAIRNMSAQQVTIAVVTSGFVWITKLLVYIVLISALHLPLSIWQVIVTITAVIIVSMLPFYTFGGFGAVEGTVAGMFVLFGVQTEVAIAAAFTIHVVQFLNYVLFGVLGIMINHFRGADPENKNSS